MKSGGKTASHLTLVNPTGVMAGTGVKVSGLSESLGALNLGEDANLPMSPMMMGTQKGRDRGKLRAILHPHREEPLSSTVDMPPFPRILPHPH